MLDIDKMHGSKAGPSAMKWRSRARAKDAGGATDGRSDSPAVPTHRFASLASKSVKLKKSASVAPVGAHPVHSWETQLSKAVQCLQTPVRASADPSKQDRSAVMDAWHMSKFKAHGCTDSPVKGSGTRRTVGAGGAGSLGDNELTDIISSVIQRQLSGITEQLAQAVKEEVELALRSRELHDCLPQVISEDM